MQRRFAKELPPVTLAEWMAETGLGDDQVAELIKTDGIPCSRSAVSRYRRFKMAPSAKVQRRIFDVTKGRVSPDKLILGDQL